MSLGNHGELIKQTLAALRKDTTTTGISTTSNLNYYHLEPIAAQTYPVFFPLLASIPRVNPMFNGMKVGGLGVNWKMITSIDVGGHPGVSEGHRNAYMNVTERDMYFPYKFLGKDIETTFQAASSGLGFQDNVSLAQASLLNGLLNDEERMTLYGNPGAAAGGYALGTTPTPTATATAGGTIAAATTCALFCVAVAPWGVQMATSTGLRLPSNRTNADLSVDPQVGYTAAISAVSATALTTTSLKSITGNVAAVIGATGYGWFINPTGTTAAGAYFAGVTPFNQIVISALPANTNQQANAIGNSSIGFSVDNSFNPLDYAGLLTIAFATSGASQPAFLQDMGGAGFTSNGDGSIQEFENVANFLWQNYKASIDKIYVGGQLIQSISKAIFLGSGGGAASATKIQYEANAQGHIIGGSLIGGYRWKFSTTAAAKVVDIVTHPWLPDGVVFFDITNNPYPAAGDRIPAVRRIVSLEDHFSIKWPYKSLQHELGVYCFQALQHYLPFCQAVYTGFANKVN